MTRRVNIKITQDMHSYFMMRSEQTGVSMSALMALALEEHMIQRQTLSLLSDIKKEADKGEN